MTTWDRAAWEIKVGEVEDLLAELYAIDHLLDNYLQAGPGGLGAPNVKVMIGRTQPFEVWLGPFGESMGEQPTTPGEVDGLSAPRGASAKYALAEDVVRHADEVGRIYADVVMDGFRERSKELVEPVASEFATVATNLQNEVQRPLEIQIETQFTELTGTLGRWEGAAAGEFQVFHSGIQAATKQQGVVAAAVAKTYAGAGAIVALGQTSLDQVAEAARAVLLEHLQGRAVDHAVRDLSVSQYLMIAASVVGVIAAAPVTGGSSMAGGVAVVSGVTSTLLTIASTGVESPEAPVRDGAIEAENAEEVGAALSEAGDEIARNVVKQWQGLHDSVESVESLLRIRNGAAGSLCPRRPNRLLDGVVSGEFEHESLSS